MIVFKPTSFVRTLATLLLLVLFSVQAHAQIVRVIDNKGTIANVNNNQVTSAATAPTTPAPLEGDIWFNTTTGISSVYDETTTDWIEIDPEKVTVSNAAPTTPAPLEGDIWFDNTDANNLLAYVHDGTSWQAINNYWLGNRTIHHNAATVLAITEALHNNADIHVESTGDLSINKTDVSDATNFYITNTTATDRILTFTDFDGAYLRNGGAVTDLKTGGLTIKANTRYLAHVTNNIGSFYFNVTEAGGSGDIVPLWKSNTDGGTYATNDIINYLGTLYKNTTGNNTDTIPPINTTDWVALSNNFISDADGDTRIQLDRTLDDDLIRFDLEGSEKFVMRGSTLEPVNNGNSVFIGENAGLNDNLTNNQNVAVGKNALAANIGAYNNVAIGSNALLVNTNGNNNIVVGKDAMAANTTGDTNVAIGNTSLSSNISGGKNVALGNSALQENTGSSNTALGHRAMINKVGGGGNVAVGTDVLDDLTNGAKNTVIGFNTGGGILTGSENTIVGADVTGLDDNLTRNIILANGNGNIRLQNDNTR